MLTRVLPCSAGSGPSVDTPQAQASGQPPTVPFAATNEHGQRICRQCGMVGRYKDGKCVEKWGPGPMGPGTVCDRSVALRFPPSGAGRRCRHDILRPSFVLFGGWHLFPSPGPEYLPPWGVPIPTCTWSLVHTQNLRILIDVGRR